MDSSNKWIAKLSSRMEAMGRSKRDFVGDDIIINQIIGCIGCPLGHYRESQRFTHYILFRENFADSYHPISREFNETISWYNQHPQFSISLRFLLTIEALYQDKLDKTNNSGAF